MAKAAPKLQIRNFLPVTTSGMDKRDPAMSMTLAVNRLGATVTDVGKILTSSHQARLDAAYQVQGRRSLAQDRAREKQIEKKTAENIDKESEARGYKKGGSGIFGLLSPLIEPLIQFAGTLATFFALDFLSRKENRKMIETGFSWIGKWLGTVWKVGSWGFSMIYDGLFDPDGNDGPLMRALKVVGGLAGIFVAGRILRPWKIAGDIGKLSKLFSGNRKAGIKQQRKIQQRQMRNQGVRRGLKGKPGKPGGGSKLLGKMGKFFKSPVGAGALSGVFAFGSRLAAGDKLNVAAGGGIGAAIGTTAVTALLVPVLGPFAPLVGGVLGGFFGDKIGAFLGEAIEPILKPIGDFFKNIAFPLWKATLKPLVQPLMDLFEPIKAVFGIIIDAVAPILSKAFQGVMDFIVGPLAKAALDSIVWIIEKASWFINNGVALARGTANNFTRMFGSESQKILAQVENEDYDVKRLKKELANLKAASARGEGGNRSIWVGVDGVPRTSNGAPGMNMANGHFHIAGSTTDEKIKHWEEELIPHAKKKAREAAEAAAAVEMATPMVSDPGAPPDGGSDGTGDFRVSAVSGGKVQDALTRTVGFGKNSYNRCADSVRQYLKAVGHPQWATIATKTGNLDPDGTAYIGPRLAASFAGTDVGKHIMNKSQLKPGDILLYRDTTRPGKFTPGAVTHVGVYAGNGDQYDHNDRKGFHKRSLAGVLTWAKWGGGIRLKGMPSAGQMDEGEKTKVSPSSNLNSRTTQLTTSSQQQDTELSSGDNGSQVVVMQPVIKTVKETVGVDNTQVVHTDLGAFTSGF